MYFGVCVCGWVFQVFHCSVNEVSFYLFALARSISLNALSFPLTIGPFIRVIPQYLIISNSSIVSRSKKRYYDQSLFSGIKYYSSFTALLYHPFQRLPHSHSLFINFSHQNAPKIVTSILLQQPYGNNTQRSHSTDEIQRYNINTAIRRGELRLFWKQSKPIKLNWKVWFASEP